MNCEAPGPWPPTSRKARGGHVREGRDVGRNGEDGVRESHASSHVDVSARVGLHPRAAHRNRKEQRLSRGIELTQKRNAETRNGMLICEEGTVTVNG